MEHQSPATRLRALLAAGRTIAAPGCFDPLSALIARDAGFECLYLGGYATSARIGLPEPFLTLTEQVSLAELILAVVDVPLIVDGHAGWGGPLHVMRAVRAYERARVAGLHIEDQEYPKRLSYHSLPLPRERIIPADEMVAKIDAALGARTDDDFLVIARTDAVHARDGGIDVAIQRAGLYAEAGADMVVAFPDTPEDVAQFAREVDAPKMLFYGEGGPRPRPAVAEAEALGYAIVGYSTSALLASFVALARMYTTLSVTGTTGIEPGVAEPARSSLQRLLGIPELIARESALADERP